MNLFDRSILLSKQDEVISKQIIKQLLNIVNSGLIPVTVLKKFKMYFPCEESSSEEEQSEDQKLDYWKNSHVNDVLQIDVKELQELQLQQNNLKKTYQQKSSAIQTLSYNSVVMLSTENLIQENGYKSSVESDSNEGSEEVSQKEKREVKFQEISNKEMSKAIIQQIIYLPSKEVQKQLLELNKKIPDQENMNQEKMIVEKGLSVPTNQEEILPHEIQSKVLIKDYQNKNIRSNQIIDNIIFKSLQKLKQQYVGYLKQMGIFDLFSYYLEALKS